MFGDTLPGRIEPKSNQFSVVSGIPLEKPIIAPGYGLVCSATNKIDRDPLYPFFKSSLMSELPKSDAIVKAYKQSVDTGFISKKVVMGFHNNISHIQMAIYNRDDDSLTPLGNLTQILESMKNEGSKAAIARLITAYQDESVVYLDMKNNAFVPVDKDIDLSHVTIAAPKLAAEDIKESVAKLLAHDKPRVVVPMGAEARAMHEDKFTNEFIPLLYSVSGRAPTPEQINTVDKGFNFADVQEAPRHIDKKSDKEKPDQQLNARFRESLRFPEKPEKESGESQAKRKADEKAYHELIELLQYQRRIDAIVNEKIETASAEAA